ncbi:MAG: hypothetical protein JRH15_17650 [Deltaproteobacteria bacterium]|nr:hypothetical protein [Deltaproteobacteria bacterium]
MGSNPGKHPFHRLGAVVGNPRGISLILIVLLMTAAATAAVGVLTLGLKLRAVEKERLVPERLDTIRKAMQRYYLSQHDLPEPLNTTPPNTVPVAALNLPQHYWFDMAGQFIRYDRNPGVGAVDILGATVRQIASAAVLIAPGPDGQIAASNLATPYADPADGPNDDVVVAVSLQAEAFKVATRTVAIIQAAAKAYDAQYDPTRFNASFDNINNDGDFAVAVIDPGPDGIFGTPDDIPDPRRPGPDGILGTADDVFVYRTRVNTVVDEGNADPVPPAFPGYVPAQGGSGEGCVRFGQLTNDPERGTASLDGCPTAANDIVAVFGLSRRYAVDPWGNPYMWGSVRWFDITGTPQAAYGGLEATDTAGEDRDRDRRYWTFFSMGPDEIADTEDDITSTDRIIGYHATDIP